MNAYSDSKPLWHADRLAELRAGRQPVPVHMQLVLSDLCNQDCHFCAYRSSAGFNSADFGGNPNRRIPTGKARSILDQAAALGVRAIQFTGGGEPTVHLDHRSLFLHAQELGLETGLVTNGVRIEPFECYERLDWIRVSLDAGTEKTYRETRKSTAWDRVMRNIRYIGTLRAYTGIGFVITPQNWGEIITAARLAADAGIDYIRYSAVFSTEGSAPYASIAEGTRANIEAAAHYLPVVDLFGNRLDDLDAQNPDYSLCGIQALTIYVGGNMKVYRCCTTAYTPRGEIGDLSRENLSDIVRRGWVQGFDARGCTVCQFNGKNRAINSMMAEPLHVNFT